MNPDFPQNEREKMEAKLTALLLGELRADEVAKLSAAMEADPELAALYERLKVTIELVREVKPAAEEPAPLKLSSEKREKLLASFKTVSPQEFARPRRVMDWLVPAAACAAIFVVLAAVVLPALSKAKYKAIRADAGGRYWGAPASAKNDIRVSTAVSDQESEMILTNVLKQNRTVWAATRKSAAETPADTLTLNSTRTQDSFADGQLLPQQPVPLAPTLASPASSTPIVLPAARNDDTWAYAGQKNEDGFSLGPVNMDLSADGDGKSKLRVDYGNAVAINGTREVAHLENADPVAVMNGRSSGASTNGFVFGAGVVRSFSDESEIAAATNASGKATHVAGIVAPELSQEKLNDSGYSISAQSYDRAVADALPGLAGSNTTIYTFNGSDQRAADRAPELKDLPGLGRLFRSNSAVASGGELYTSLTKDDVSGLRYLTTNGTVVAGGEFRRELPIINSTYDYAYLETNGAAQARFSPAATEEAVKRAFEAYNRSSDESTNNGAVASQPNIAYWRLIDGSTNSARVNPNGGALADLGSSVARNNSIDLQGGSSFRVEQNTQFVFAAGNSGVALNDQNGRNSLQENQNSVLTTRANSASAANATEFGGGGGGGFGGGGGGGRGGFGGRGGRAAAPAQNPQANEGTQVAAANAPASVATDKSQLETKTFKVDPKTFNMGLQNVGTIGFGNVRTNAPAEMVNGPSIASASKTASAEARGSRYVTGIESDTEQQIAVKNLLHAVGVNSQSVYYNDRQGTLTVRGTKDDLELVQEMANALSVAPPEVAVKSKFAEVNQNDNKQLGFDWYLGGFATNNASQLAETEDRLVAKGEREYVGYDDPGPFVPTIQSSNGGIPLTATLPLPRTRVVGSATNKWWNASAGAKGFYDDNLLNEKTVTTVSGRISTNQLLDVVTLPENKSNSIYSANVVGYVNVTNAGRFSLISDQAVQYASAKEELDHAKLWRQTLELKTKQEQTDLNLPQTRMVTVMNPATSTASEKSGIGEKIKEALTGKVERVASIQIDQERPDINVNGLQTSYGSGYDEGFMQSEFEAIQSDAVLGRVVEKLKLDGGDPKKTKAAEEKLKKNLNLRNAKNTKFIGIGVKSEKPEDAARIANAVAEAYRDYRSQEYEELKHGGIRSLERQLAEQDQKIVLLQAKVDELGKSLPSQSKDIASLKVQKEAEYNQEKALLEKLKAMNKGDLRKALPVAVADGHLNDLLAEYDLAQQALLKLKVANASDSSKLKNSQALVEDLDRKIDARSQEIMLGLEAKLAFAKSSLDAVTAETKSAGQPDTALPKPTVPPPTPQPEVLTRENAFSTFSLNVSDVSFKLAAATLEKGQMPEPGSIRSEEFINAFDYRDPDAAPGVPIAFASERARYPFAHNRELLRFSLKTAAAGRQAGRSLNIVLLLDNSGSMERADRVSIIREALRVLAGQLHAGDTFSVVTFARTAQLRVDGIQGNQAGAAAEEIGKLTPEGGTNLGDAMDLAYETARRHYLANGDNRVVLLTDGAANLGDVNADTLKQKVEAQRQQGIALDCFGIGWEGFNDDLLEVLTRHGDGRYGFINTPEEASTEFVAQIAGALHVAASDVKVQVEFNTNRVTSYRQIGYAKHQLTKEQFRDNTVDAAEIAAQEAGNALYTIETDPAGSGPIATVRVRYKIPGTTEYREQAWDVPYTGGAVAMDQASPAMRLASTACAFSEWLATSPFAAGVSTDDLLRYMNGVPQFYGADARPAKLEWMIRQAKSVSGK